MAKRWVDSMAALRGIPGIGKSKCEQYGELFIKVIKDMNVTEPYFDGYVIDQTYACRENKGTHKALLQAFHYTKGSDYFCKMDVRKYFDSIDHEMLKQLLRRRFKDRKLLHVFDRIIDSYETVPGKGVPIGNLTSQHFANFYLNTLDRFCKERLGCRRYVRYMDDYVFWEDDIRSIKQKRDAIQSFLTETLTLSLKLSHFDSVNRGVPFLGFLVKPTGIHLLKQSKRRFRRTVKKKYHELANGTITENEFAASMSAVIEHTRIARAYWFRKQTIVEFEGSFQGTGV